MNNVIYFVARVFFSKKDGSQSNSIQAFDSEIKARKRFWAILTTDADNADIDYEMVQIVRSDGSRIDLQICDNREPAPTPDPESEATV